MDSLRNFLTYGAPLCALRARDLRYKLEMNLEYLAIEQSIQLFLRKLSDKVHATIPKGIVGGFEFTVFQRNLNEWQGRPWTYVCEC